MSRRLLLLSESDSFEGLPPVCEVCGALLSSKHLLDKYQVFKLVDRSRRGEPLSPINIAFTYEAPFQWDTMIQWWGEDWKSIRWVVTHPYAVRSLARTGAITFLREGLPQSEVLVLAGIGIGSVYATNDHGCKMVLFQTRER